MRVFCISEILFSPGDFSTFVALPKGADANLTYIDYDEYMGLATYRAFSVSRTTSLAIGDEIIFPVSNLPAIPFYDGESVYTHQGEVSFVKAQVVREEF